jgi:hypothetical protein
VIYQFIGYYCIAPPTPSKGGETYTRISCHKTKLKLMDMPFMAGEKKKKIV